MPMGMCMMGSGEMIRRKGLESISIWMGRGIKGTGKKINNMARERRAGLMVQFTTEFISKERRKEKACFSGLMGASIRVISKTITSKVKEFTNGQMIVSTKVTG